MVDMFLDLQTKPKVASDLVELPLQFTVEQRLY